MASCSNQPINANNCVGTKNRYQREDLDADASTHPEVPEDHEIPFADNRDEGHK